MKRFLFSVVWVGLAIALLAVSIRASTVRVLASQTGVPSAEGQVTSPAQSGSVPMTFGDASVVTDVNIGVDEHVIPTQGTLTLTPRAYMPLIYYKWFQEYWYEDDFENWGSGWPYGDVEEYNDRSADFQYGYKKPNGDRVYHIRLKDMNDHVFVTGPAYVQGNFEYWAFVRRATTDRPKRDDDEYGLLLSPTPINTEDPHGESVYTFHIRLRIRDEEPPMYLVEKWSIDGLFDPSSEMLVQGEEDYYLTDEAEEWNALRIVRTENKLRVYVTTQDRNYQWLWVNPNTTIEDLPDLLYIGFYAYHARERSYTFEFHFDDVWVHACPKPGCITP